MKDKSISSTLDKIVDDIKELKRSNDLIYKTIVNKQQTNDFGGYRGGFGNQVSSFGGDSNGSTINHNKIMEDFNKRLEDFNKRLEDLKSSSEYRASTSSDLAKRMEDLTKKFKDLNKTLDKQITPVLLENFNIDDVILKPIGKDIFYKNKHEHLYIQTPKMELKILRKGKIVRFIFNKDKKFLGCLNFLINKIKTYYTDYNVNIHGLFRDYLTVDLNNYTHCLLDDESITQNELKHISDHFTNYITTVGILGFEYVVDEVNKNCTIHCKLIKLNQ